MLFLPSEANISRPSNSLYGLICCLGDVHRTSSTVGVFVTCCILPLKYLLTSVRNVLTSTTSSRWGHSLLSCVRRRWRKFLMKVTEATVFSARVPWGLCIVPETLNLALAFWSICIRVFPLSQCVARLLREMATRHDLEYQNEYGRHDKCLPLLWHTLSKPISW